MSAFVAVPVSATVNPLTVTAPAALAVHVSLSTTTLVAPGATAAAAGKASGVATVSVPAAVVIVNALDATSGGPVTVPLAAAARSAVTSRVRAVLAGIV